MPTIPTARKPILCLDFDGVLHSYTSGWKGADVIPDPPVPGTFEFLEAAHEHFEVHIFSSRSGQAGGIDSMRAWLVQHAGYAETFAPLPAWLAEIRFPIDKPPAMVTIDDRALTFTGVFPPVEELRNFAPWNKKRA